MKKQAQYKIKGMARDLAKSVFSPEFAYENKNIRIETSEKNSLLCLTNEKGNNLLPILGGDGKEIILDGIPLGKAIIDNELILFTKGTKDNIYKIWFENNILKGIKLFSDDLNLSVNYPIETLPFFENEKIKKVYWVDGKNQPRMINVASIKADADKYSFDFVRRVKLDKTRVDITKNSSSNGMFAPGVIQYAFTYFDKYGQESNIFYTSPQYYTSFRDRGASPEDKVSNSFLIEMHNLDESFDYVRVYSILRTSINAIPECKIVADLIPTESDRTINFKAWHDISPAPSGKLNMYSSNRNDITVYVPKTDSILPIQMFKSGEKWEDGFVYITYIIPNNKGDIYILDGKNSAIISKDKIGNTVITEKNQNSGTSSFILTSSGVSTNGAYSFKYTAGLVYTDNGTQGSIIDPTELLYVGGEEIIAGTIAQKDNTLFLGNIEKENKTVSRDIKNSLKGLTINFSSSKSIDLFNRGGYYPYINQLKYNSSKIKTFKYLEWYRFGVQLQYKTGKWSEPIFIGDYKNTTPIISEEDGYNNGTAKLVEASLKLDNTKTSKLIEEGFINIRPVIVYPNISERECICQGILCPTVYNVRDRSSGTPFAQSSWFSRPFPPKNPRANRTSEVFNGYYAEFRHNYSLPSNIKLNSEIQCNVVDYEFPSYPSGEEGWPPKDEFKSNCSNMFYVDQSIITMHSPDIELNPEFDNLDLSNTKLRIVGWVPLDTNMSDIDIQTSTTVNNFKGGKKTPLGFYKKNINTIAEGYRGMISAPFWFDEITNNKIKDPDNKTTGFVVYPWHRDGSLNNTVSKNEEGYRSAMLDKKKMSNLRCSKLSKYLNTVWECKDGIADVQLFNSNEQTLLKLKAPNNSKLNDITYYGNVDTVLNPVNTYVSATKEELGYDIAYSTRLNLKDSSADLLFSGSKDGKGILYNCIKSTESDNILGVDPVRIKYKSSPHIVMDLNYSILGVQNILPSKNNVNRNVGNSSYTNFWNGGECIYKQDDITAPEDNKGYLWLGELYRDINTKTLFGGVSEEAIENNLWLPCGEPIKVENTTIVKWTEGDTYYQRYDNLKTYPYTLEDQNSVVEIISFMCETRMNIDGRYDKNRGQLNNLTMTPANFNKINPVYSQQNNFFNYRAVNSNRLNVSKFNNTVTWTKTKTIGELTDTWTNITLASTLDLDGDKGELRALKRFNNNLIAFQDTGISQILYNENTQISTTEGVPIEIANSGKVQGKRYLSDRIGCLNKWSICESPNGIYFIDDITKGMYLFNGQLTNLSDNLGMRSWINESSLGTSIWNPDTFNSFVTYYDNKNNDVLFINDKECLAFSEVLKTFTSFYSYEKTPYIVNLEDKVLSINKDLSKTDNIYKIWQQNAGDYNMFFGVYNPFYTEIIANPDEPYDKIFSNLEFRADSFNGEDLLDTTFDTINAKNEYQEGEDKLTFTHGIPSNLKKKFRIWRANIPRNNKSLNHKRDRIRNTWANIRLSMNTPNINKTRLYDMILDYYI